MKFCFSPYGLSALAWLTLSIAAGPANGISFDARGAQFIAFHSFGRFEKARGEGRREVVLTSPEIVAQTSWDQAIVSWNADTPEGAWLKVEARAIFPAGPTKWYNMGLWSTDPARHPRESVLRQKDGDGDVDTDTLILNRLTDRLQVRLTMGRDDLDPVRMKYLGVSVMNSKLELPALDPNRRAWGKVIDVPERTQMIYPKGNSICSPTTVSMMMAYWAARLNRPELDRDVPEIVAAVYDANWRGTGNWVFNTAYAGSFKGIRAYVTRMTDLTELEEWIAAGIPVGLSLCYDKLRGRTDSTPAGHLVVCVGFTENGDPIINDSGTRENVRKVFKRQNLVRAWAHSRNAAYLIYPEDSEIPRDRFGHWDSWTARKRIVLESARYK